MLIFALMFDLMMIFIAFILIMVASNALTELLEPYAFRKLDVREHVNIARIGSHRKYYPWFFVLLMLVFPLLGVFSMPFWLNFIISMLIMIAGVTIVSIFTDWFITRTEGKNDDEPYKEDDTDLSEMLF